MTQFFTNCKWKFFSEPYQLILSQESWFMAHEKPESTRLMPGGYRWLPTGLESTYLLEFILIKYYKNWDKLLVQKNKL